MVPTPADALHSARRQMWLGGLAVLLGGLLVFIGVHGLAKSVERLDGDGMPEAAHACLFHCGPVKAR